MRILSVRFGRVDLVEFMSRALAGASWDGLAMLWGRPDRDLPGGRRPSDHLRSPGVAAIGLIDDCAGLWLPNCPWGGTTTTVASWWAAACPSPSSPRPPLFRRGPRCAGALLRRPAGRAPTAHCTSCAWTIDGDLDRGGHPGGPISLIECNCPMVGSTCSRLRCRVFLLKPVGCCRDRRRHQR